MGGNLLLNRLVNPYQKQVCSGWHLKEIEEWLLLSPMCTVVCSYCMSHQHLDAKIVNISPDVWEMYGWEPTFESLGKPILGVAFKRDRGAGIHVCSGWHLKEIEEYGWEPTIIGVAFKRSIEDRGVVTAITHVYSGLLILHVSSTPRC